MKINILKTKNYEKFEDEKNENETLNNNFIEYFDNNQIKEMNNKKNNIFDLRNKKL